MTLDDFTQRTDEELQEEIQSNPVNDNDNSQPPITDFFNSAGNTNINEEPETDESVNTERPKGKIVLGKVISGKSAVTLINIFIPSFIVFALNRFGYDAEKRQFKLTAEEREIMNPVVQDCLDYIVINFDNPFYALAFVSSMIYGSKVFDVIPDLKKIKDEAIEDNNDEDNEQDEADYKPNREYIEVRKKIESTSVRKEKVRIIIEAIEQASPSDLIEAWKVYNGIFPERNENYFRSWYERNLESFPENIRFDIGSPL